MGFWRERVKGGGICTFLPRERHALGKNRVLLSLFTQRYAGNDDFLGKMEGKRSQFTRSSAFFKYARGDMPYRCLKALEKLQISKYPTDIAATEMDSPCTVINSTALFNR